MSGEEVKMVDGWSERGWQEEPRGMRLAKEPLRFKTDRYLSERNVYTFLSSRKKIEGEEEEQVRHFGVKLAREPSRGCRNSYCEVSDWNGMWDRISSDPSLFTSMISPGGREGRREKEREEKNRKVEKEKRPREKVRGRKRGNV